ncbi:hypothetical protein HUU62_24065 [Rhodoferax sp. 4810]|nr:hypothetical protein [Rhodoferax jenense]
MTPEAAEEQSTITGGFFTANDRYGEFDLLVGCFCAQITDDSFWSSPGAAVIEIDDTLLTVRLLG